MSLPYTSAQLSRGIAQLLFYQTTHGNMDVAEDYVTPEHFPLGEFVKGIRDSYESGMLSQEQVGRFSDIGFSMEKDLQIWESMYLMTKKYVNEHNGKLPKPTEHTPDFVLLGAWVRKQRLTYHLLRPMQQARLREVGICGR